MQVMHRIELLIQPRRVSMGLVKEGSPFLGKRKPSMGLSFQMAN
jgi:hypothetical protein